MDVFLLKLNGLELNDVIKQEIDCFLLTGDFESPTGKVICVNPTLLSLNGEKVCQVRYLTSPIDAFFPSKSENLTSISSYCKRKLQVLASGLQLRKGRVKFHIHVGDSLELCLKDETIKNKMHVIHCSDDLVDVVGLANLLPITSCCLSTEKPEAVLITEVTNSWLKVKKPRLTDYVDWELCCPLSMIPTFYGMRLMDHLHLGSPVCLLQHDFISNCNPITLKWRRTPVNYSLNIRLEVSPALKTVIGRLVESCLTQSHGWNCAPKSTRSVSHRLFLRNVIQGGVLRYTPTTLYDILQPFRINHDWERGAEETLFRKSIPTSFQLAWRTQQAWLKGQQVLLFYSDRNDLRDSIHRGKLESDFIHVKLVIKSDYQGYSPGQSLGQQSADEHHVFNLNWNRSEKLIISFLLAKDHGLDLTKTYLIAVDPSRKILFSIRLTDWEPKMVVNPNPFAAVTQPPCYDDEDAIGIGGLEVIRCFELEDAYLLDVGIQEGKFASSNGIYTIFYILKDSG